MFRKTVTAIAAAAVLATASFTATSAAEAASKRDRIIAGVAIGVAAALLGAEFKAGHDNKRAGGSDHRGGHKGGKHQRQGFGSHCKDLPVFGGRKGQVVGFQRVCN